MNEPWMKACPEADQIKADLRACKTPGEIHECSDKHRAQVRELHANRVTRCHALQIINLKDYRLQQMRGDRIE